MSEEDQKNEATFRKVIEEGFNKGNLAALDDLFHPDGIKEHQFGMPPTVEGVKDAIRGLRSAFPDFKMSIEDVVFDNEKKLWIRMRARGTHGGQFLGFPPTNRTFEIGVIDICRFENGKIAEHWGIPDRFHLMYQLGLIPAEKQRSASSANC